MEAVGSLSVLRIAIGILVTVIAVGVVSYAVYYAVNHAAPPPGPPPPVGPTGPPRQDGINMFFQNTRADSIWVVPTYGTSLDDHTPRWTNWPFVSGNTGPVIVPHTPSLVPIKIAPLGVGTMTVLTAGMASVKFTIRVDCQEPSMICKYGDSTPFPGLDYPVDNPTGFYRNVNVTGGVPFKPAIDTLVEFTWGCAYKDAENCGVNPSCIQFPNTTPCAGISTLMGTHTGAYWDKDDGLLYDGNHMNILPVIGMNAIGTLSNVTYFDISCVDGYTVPVTLKVRRPVSAVQAASTLTECLVKYSDDAPRLDVVSDPDWQTVADTSNIKLAACPTDELLWPSDKAVTGLPGTGTDGYNTNIGQTQYVMPWLTHNMNPTGPTGSPPVLLSNAFVPGVTTDLNFYRDPREQIAVPLAGFNYDQKIGCASACSALTRNSAVSMLYPTPSGLTGHQFGTGTYLVDSLNYPLLASSRGVSDICCVAPPAGAVVNSQLQCNTSTWWYGNGTTGPVGVSDQYANYAFGFYANVYAPDHTSPWFVQGPTGPLSINPYGGGPEVSKYTTVVRGGVTGQLQTTRAYTYPYDDQFCTVTSTVVDPVNLKSILGGRGQFYSNYDVLVVIGTDDSPNS